MEDVGDTLGVERELVSGLSPGGFDGETLRDRDLDLDRDRDGKTPPPARVWAN